MKLEDKKYLLDTGEKINLSSIMGSRGLVMFFYPKAHTPGCTLEVKEFAKRKEEFDSLHYNIVGISADSPEEQNKFACDFVIDYPLIADVEKDLINQFNLWGPIKTWGGEETIGIKRSTFVVNPNMEVILELDDVNPTEHIETILEKLKERSTN
ncbi:peroxiredoxin [Spiroplasma culicicola]|uniref:thioredoxin-dependent peroxiredoxin n=1 Tax=Spiroplasma culicicola AES-1 TaxID=1276246 RepID=W6AI13_9MOLU|nr:peroxiredoxin [Spiroplasma culicicola]AHI53339.1 ahpC/TSA family protein [Spiroplasma culicicola AES-1]